MVPRLRIPISAANLRRPACRRGILALSLALSAVGWSTSLLAQGSPFISPRLEPVRGTVVNAITHEPIGHALVLSPDNRFATMTDDQGHFEFAVIEPKSNPATGTNSTGANTQDPDLYRPSMLMGRKPGFLSEDENQSAIPVNPTDPVITINLVPEALVLGQISFPTADYLNRIQVQLYRRTRRNGSEHWDNTHTVRSRADGSFRFAELPRGEYKIVTRELLDRDPVTFDARGPLFGYVPAYYPSAPDFISAETIHIAPGATVHANISPARREYYRVKIAVPNASSGLQIEVWPQGRPGPGYSLAFVPQDGAIEGTLPDGTYAIQAFEYGGSSRSGTANITVRGEPSMTGSLVLLPDPTITVSVQEEFQNASTLGVSHVSQYLEDGTRSFTASSKRPSYLQVNLVPLDIVGNTPNASLRSPTGPDDESLAIPNVRPGKYRVQATTAVGYIASLTLGGTNLLHAPLQMDSGGAPPPMEVRVRDDGADVQGSVEGAALQQGLSITSINSRTAVPTVYFLPSVESAGQFRMVWVSPSGHFEQRQLAPGAYRVLALDHQDPDMEFAAEEVLAQYDSVIQNIQVAAGQKTTMQLSLPRKTP